MNIITQILASDDNIIVSYAQVDLNKHTRKPDMQSQCLFVWLNILLSLQFNSLYEYTINIFNKHF